MTSHELFVRLAYALDQHDDACLLMVLLARNAVDQSRRLTTTTIAERDTPGHMDRNRVKRATDRLVARGLIRTRVYVKTWTEYTIDGAALRALLANSAERLSKLPGLDGQSIAFADTFDLPAPTDAVQVTEPPPTHACPQEIDP